MSDEERNNQDPKRCATCGRVFLRGPGQPPSPTSQAGSAHADCLPFACEKCGAEPGVFCHNLKHPDYVAAWPHWARLQMSWRPSC